MATQYVKGSKPVPARFAEGGECINKTNSRFIKTPDTFRTSQQRTDYGKSSPGGEMSDTEGDSKKLPAVKPRS